MKKLLFLFLIFGFGLCSQAVFAQRIPPQVGIWKVTGKDEDQTVWKADLRFTKKQNFRSLVKYKGYFFWRSTDGETKGIEYFNGVFYKKSGILRLTTSVIKNIRGELAKGWYLSTVTGNGKKLSKGSWGGVDVAKGNWSANWVRRR